MENQSPAEPLTKKDYQYILAMLNGYCDPEDKQGAEIRRKVSMLVRTMPDCDMIFFDTGE